MGYWSCKIINMISDQIQRSNAPFLKKRLLRLIIMIQRRIFSDQYRNQIRRSQRHSQLYHDDRLFSLLNEYDEIKAELKTRSFKIHDPDQKNISEWVNYCEQQGFDTSHTSHNILNLMNERLYHQYIKREG